jgi:hypothetical protein
MVVHITVNGARETVLDDRSTCRVNPHGIPAITRERAH